MPSRLTSLVPFATLLLAACSSSSGPSAPTNQHGDAAAGGASGSGGLSTASGGSTTSTGGTTSSGGTATASGGTTASTGGTTAASGGTTAASGGTTAASGGTTASTGGSTGAGTPPTLAGDGIAWTWNGTTFTGDKTVTGGWSFYREWMTLSGGTDTNSPSADTFAFAGVTANKTGTFKCSDMLAANSSFTFGWGVNHPGESVPVKGFGYVADLPCSVTVTRADPGDTTGDVFEATFDATLRFPGAGAVVPPEERSVTGSIRFTKK